MLRRKFKRLLEIGDDRVEVCQLQMRRSQVSFVRPVIGSQAHRCLELPDGPAAITCLEESEPQIIVGVRIFRLKFHCFPKSILGLLPLPAPSSTYPQV